MTSKLKKGGLSKSSWILLSLLLLAIAFIIFQNKEKIFGDKQSVIPNKTLNAVKSDSSKSILFKKIDTLLSNVSNKEKLETLQQNFLLLISSMKEEDLPTVASYNKYISTKNIPSDLKFFFISCLQNYISNPSVSFTKLKSKNILFSINQDSINSADILFNTENLSTENFISLKEKIGNRIIFSGTYTSPLFIPAGLAIDGEKTINPFVQSWDGLLIIKSNKKIIFQNIHNLIYNNTYYNITKNIQDYKSFIKIAKDDKLKIIQSHLLIYNDSVIVENDGSKGKARRRVIFETADKGLHIYDSFDMPLTLFELASFLHDNFHPLNAINLDMGDFNFYREYFNKDITNDFSAFSKNKEISNFISISY